MLKNLSLLVLFSFLGYLISEGVASFLYFKGYLSPEVLWVMEQTDPEGQMQFSEKTGVKLSSKPARLAIWNSRSGVYSVTHFRGNNYGFSDPKDFYPKKKSRDIYRVIVLGDSFSAGLVTDSPWPLEVEKNLKVRDSKIKVEIYNMSIDGAGLATWRTILHKVLIKDEFEVDDLVLAVCCDDISRTHFWVDSSFFSQLPGAKPLAYLFYSDTFDPEAFLPPSPDRGTFNFQWPVVTPKEMDAIVDGDSTHLHWRRPVRHYLFKSLKKLVFKKSEPEKPLSHWQKVFLQEFKSYAKNNKLNIRVLDIDAAPMQLRQSAEILQPLEIVSVQHALNDIPLSERNSMLVPFDEHWNRQGARIVGQVLTEKVMKWSRQWHQKEGSADVPHTKDAEDE